MNKALSKGREFVDYFINKEKDFLYKICPEAFGHKDFRFYMEWFIIAIYDNSNNEYDIESRFTDYFCNNFSLNIIFFTYIISDEFRKRVEKDIEEYKKKYHKKRI